jgi:hypothetical protein
LTGLPWVSHECVGWEISVPWAATVHGFVIRET